MSSALAQLHHDVQNGCAASRVSLNRIDIANKDIAVKLLLHFAHSSKQNRLVFRRQRLFDIRLQSPQHERPEDFVQLRNQFVLFVVVIYRSTYSKGDNGKEREGGRHR